MGGLFHKIEEANFTKIIGLIKSESGEASFEQIFSSESCRNWKNYETAMLSLSDLVVVGW